MEHLSSRHFKRHGTSLYPAHVDAQVFLRSNKDYERKPWPKLWQGNTVTRTRLTCLYLRFSFPNCFTSIILFFYLLFHLFTQTHTVYKYITYINIYEYIYIYTYTYRYIYNWVLLMNEKKNSNEFLVNFCNISFFVPKFYITMSSIPRFVPKHGFADPFPD